MQGGESLLHMSMTAFVMETQCSFVQPPGWALSAVEDAYVEAALKHGHTRFQQANVT